VVTVLTSLGKAASEQIFGSPPQKKVYEFAHMAAAAGADGIVCSPHELATLRSDPTLQSLITVVPGIRPSWAAQGDQTRIMTPREAILAGASAIVVGRPILHPPAAIGGRSEAAARIAEEIQDALESR
jgi:orotidine-5'-phosphate decarboxylase